MKKSDYVPHTCVNFLRIRFEGLLHSLCQNLELDIVSKYNRHTFWSSFNMSQRLCGLCLLMVYGVFN